MLRECLPPASPLILAGAVLALAGCRGADTASFEGDPADRHAVAVDLAREVLSTYETFLAGAEALDQAASAYAADPTGSGRGPVQEAWRDAMRVWQLCELTQFGPAAALNDSPGAADFRDRIYSWPTVNPCAVDQELVRGDYRDPDALAGKLPNVRGLDALEYLLFNEDDTNACTAQATINLGGEWQAIRTELSGRRAAYAAALAAEVSGLARDLVTAFGGSSGYLAQLERGDPSLYPNAQGALNAISHALFYLDKEVKDRKLAEPAGLSDACASASCPTRLESRYARQSKQHLRQNLVMFRRMLAGDPEGSGRLSFEALLDRVGAPDVASAMLGATDAAIRAVDALGELTLAEALESNLDGVRAIHAAVKGVTDELKTRFISVLDLELPRIAEGDND
jgi:uncharacterized protein